MMTKNKNNLIEPICPFLGLYDDLSTSINFPSQGNCCHKSTPVIVPSFEQQEIVCLRNTYKDCPAYNRIGKHRLPNELSWKEVVTFNKKPLLWIILSLICVGLFILILFQGTLNSLWNPTSTIRIYLTQTPLTTLTLTEPTLTMQVLLSTPSSTPTIEPTFSMTPTVTWFPVLSRTSTVTLTPTYSSNQNHTSITGCTDPTASNYNAAATVNDGSCTYPPISGCTDPTASNYNAAATVDDGSCTYPPISGCTDPTASNYNATATVDDGSCTFPP